jgi:aldose 1-epimerase
MRNPFRAIAPSVRPPRLATALLTTTLAACSQAAPPPPEEKPMNPFSWSVEKDAESGWTAVTLRHDDPTDAKRSQAVRICPEAGGILFSYVFGGVELLHAPPSIGKANSGGTGNPILYPTPNRVRNGRFTFEGREFRFSDDDKTTIHGLVRKLPWRADPPRRETGGAGDGAALKTWIDFEPGSTPYERFPIRHRLELDYRLTRSGLRMIFTVVNRDTQKLPFGFAIHPYFRILGEREHTFIRVPAARKMEATPDLLPTGALMPLEGAAYDLRRPRPLSDLALDDVYWGMKPGEPAGYEARDAGLRVDLPASEHFTHMVVYTPKGRPFFCMENQTCSTDAHNLHARGKTAEAHLLVVDPGKTLSGWVEIRPAWTR